MSKCSQSYILAKNYSYCITMLTYLFNNADTIFERFAQLNALMALGVLFASQSTVAQSNNYWSWNFNTPSNLLAGAVIGGGAGPSAIYYNPAQINHENTPSLSMSASIMSLQFFNAQNVAGNGIDADKFIFKIQPKFISFILPNKNSKLGLEAAVLSPVSEELEYTIQHFDQLDLIERTEGDEVYSGYLRYRRKYNTTYFGFGASYELSSNFFLGLSSFIAIDVSNYSFQQNAIAFQESDSVHVGSISEPRYISTNLSLEELKYWHMSLIFKVGFQYKSTNQQFSAGLNITIPSIGIYGQADIRKELGRSNIFDNSSGLFTRNEAFIGLEENVKATVKSPLSIAIGVQYSTENKRSIGVITFEYFNKINPYAVAKGSTAFLDIPEYVSSVIPDADYMSFYYQANSVTNFGIGFKQYIGVKMFLLGGFRTDFTNSSKDDIRFVDNHFRTLRVHLDKYHFTLGPVLRIKNTEVITGIQYTIARKQNGIQVINYSDPVEYDPASNQALEGIKQQNASFRLNELALFLGLRVNL